jgi:DNA replication and repair protein RecF
MVNTHTTPQRLVSHLSLKQFRCFTEREFDFNAPLVLIEGANGSGKTSLVEALHFLCYVRSFRALSPREMINHDQQGFFVKVTLVSDGIEDSLQAGFAGAQRLVKINDQTAKSYKELIDHYRVITITEHDLGLIQEGPALRRQFIDLAMGIQNPAWAEYLKKATDLHEQRSRALYNSSCTPSLYEAWTATEWEHTRMIQLKRIEYLSELEETVHTLLSTELFKSAAPVITLQYQPKINCLQDSYAEFLRLNPGLYTQETAACRTLFGFHLDDIVIHFGGKQSRYYASRGQQKLTLLVLKAAQTMLLPPSKGPTLIILDDFVTDLDDTRIRQLFTLFIGLGAQLFVTSPRIDPTLREIIAQSGYPHQIITL